LPAHSRRSARHPLSKQETVHEIKKALLEPAAGVAYVDFMAKTFTTETFMTKTFMTKA